jgi:HlyD family secretion protein
VVTYTTIINAPNNDQKLKPGMTANIVIYTNEINDALLISAKALKYEPDAAVAKQYKRAPAADTATQAKAAHTSFVWIKQGANLVQREITTGLNNDTQVQVLKGLTANDEVVTGATEAAVAATTATKSPFMPSRPGGRKK